MKAHFLRQKGFLRQKAFLGQKAFFYANFFFKKFFCLKIAPLPQYLFYLFIASYNCFFIKSWNSECLIK